MRSLPGLATGLCGVGAAGGPTNAEAADTPSTAVATSAARRLDRACQAHQFDALCTWVEKMYWL